MADLQVMGAKPDREAILPYIKVCQQLIRCGRMLETSPNVLFPARSCPNSTNMPALHHIALAQLNTAFC